MKKFGRICTFQIIAAIFACTLISTAVCRADNTLVTRATAGNESLMLPDVSKMSDEDAVAAIDQAAERVHALRQSILAQLKQPNLGDEKKASLYRFAAGLRVYEAMDIMINDIGFNLSSKGAAPPTAPLPYGVHGPVAQEMLPSFGLIGMGEIMEVMSDHKKDVPFVIANKDAYAWVLWAIEGKRFALIRLQDRLTKEKDPKVRSQYMSVIQWLNRVPDGV